MVADSSVIDLMRSSLRAQAINIGPCRTISYTIDAAQSHPFSPETVILRLIPTTACWISSGPNPTAVKEGPTSMYLKNDMVVLISVNPGDRVSVIRDSVGGKLYLTEGTL